MSPVTRLRAIAVIVLVGLAGLAVGQSPASAAPRPEVAAPSDLVEIANFGRPVNDLQHVPAAAGVAIGSAMVIELPADADGMGGLDRSGAQLNGPSADGRFTEVVAQGGPAGGAFGMVTEIHDVIEARLPVHLAPGTTLRSTPGGGLIQTDRSGWTIASIDPAFAIDEAGNELPASYTFDATTSTLVVQADTTNAMGAVFIDPSWNCVKAVAQLVGWAHAAGLAAWVASMVFTGGLSAVIGFFAWQGIAAWRTWGVINACR